MIYIDLEIHRKFLIRDLVPLRNRLVATVIDGRLKELLAKARKGLDEGEGEELKNKASNFVQTFIHLRHKINEIFKNLDRKIAETEQRIGDPEDNQGLKKELDKLVSEAESLEDVALESMELWEKHAPDGYQSTSRHGDRPYKQRRYGQ